MPGLFSTLQGGASYVKSVAGYHMRNTSAMGKATAAGAALGAANSAYQHRKGYDVDENLRITGQTNNSLSGAIMGGLVGAAIGRYGYAAGKKGLNYNAASTRQQFGAGAKQQFNSSMIGASLGHGARGAYRQARRDASSAASYLGGHLRANRGFNPLRGIAPGV